MYVRPVTFVLFVVLVFVCSGQLRLVCLLGTLLGWVLSCLVVGCALGSGFLRVRSCFSCRVVALVLCASYMYRSIEKYSSNGE
jgi:hypothetical protein